MSRVVKITTETNEFVSFGIEFEDACIISPCNYTHVKRWFVDGKQLSLDRNDSYLLFFNYHKPPTITKEPKQITSEDKLFVSDKKIPIFVNSIPFRLPCYKKVAYKLQYPENFNAFRPLFNGMPVYNANKALVGICAFPNYWDCFILTNLEPLPDLFKPLKIHITSPYRYIYDQKQELVFVFLGRTMIFRKYFPNHFIHEPNECNVLTSDSDFSVLKFQDGREEVINQGTIVEYFNTKPHVEIQKPSTPQNVLGNTRFLQSVDLKRWLCISTC